ncbi:MAG: hypothetical protein ACRD0K_06770 [Egibacteraceae bacterium]
MTGAAVSVELIVCAAGEQPKPPETFYTIRDPAAWATGRPFFPACCLARVCAVTVWDVRQPGASPSQGVRTALTLTGANAACPMSDVAVAASCSGEWSRGLAAAAFQTPGPAAPPGPRASPFQDAEGSCPRWRPHQGRDPWARTLL